MMQSDVTIQVQQKPFIVEDDGWASLTDWLRAGYGPMFARNPVLLKGIVPDPIYTAQRIAEQLRHTGGAVHVCPYVWTFSHQPMYQVN